VLIQSYDDIYSAFTQIRVSQQTFICIMDNKLFYNSIKKQEKKSKILSNSFPIF
jgi:hypothetical protein